MKPSVREVLIRFENNRLKGYDGLTLTQALSALSSIVQECIGKNENYIDEDYPNSNDNCERHIRNIAKLKIRQAFKERGL